MLRIQQIAAGSTRQLAEARRFEAVADVAEQGVDQIVLLHFRDRVLEVLVIQVLEDH